MKPILSKFSLIEFHNDLILFYFARDEIIRTKKGKSIKSLIKFTKFFLGLPDLECKNPDRYWTVAKSCRKL